MAVRLSALRAGSPPFTSQEDSWYSFLLEGESTPAERNKSLSDEIMQIGLMVETKKKRSFVALQILNQQQMKNMTDEGS
jgi:hypothetical protein